MRFRLLHPFPRRRTDGAPDMATAAILRCALPDFIETKIREKNAHFEDSCIFFRNTIRFAIDKE